MIQIWQKMQYQIYLQPFWLLADKRIRKDGLNANSMSQQLSTKTTNFIEFELRLCFDKIKTELQFQTDNCRLMIVEYLVCGL